MNKREISRLQNDDLKKLLHHDILLKSPMGVRNIIRASTGSVDRIGFDLPHHLKNFPTHPQLMNFHPGSIMWEARVDYNGQRAQISCTSGFPSWKDTICDLSSHFPVNNLCMSLLAQDTTKCLQGNPCKNIIYGDAILITETRQHWWMYPGKFDREEILLTYDSLKSPRTLYFDVSNRPYIHFIEKPYVEDIVYLKLAHYVP